MESGALASGALADAQPPPEPMPADWAASEAWLEAAVQLAQGQVAHLFSYFRVQRKEDQTVLIMRIKDEFLASAFPLQPPPNQLEQQQLEPKRGQSAGADGNGGADVPMTDACDEGGASSAAERNRALALRTTYLYYGVLHYALRKLYPMTLARARPALGAQPGSAASAASPGGGGAQRFARPAVSPDDVPRVAQLLSIPVFHQSLLAVAATLARAVLERDLGATPELFLRYATGAGLQFNMLALWNAARWFTEYYALPPADARSAAACAAMATGVEAPPPLSAGGGGSGSGSGGGGGQVEGGLPLLPGRYALERLMRLAEERGVMAEGSTFFAIVQNGAAGGFNDGDSLLVRTFLAAYGQRAVRRAAAVAHLMMRSLGVQAHLAQLQLREQPFGRSSSYMAAAAAVAMLPKLASELMDRLLATRLDLAFNQNMSVLAACCVYTLIRAFKAVPRVSFAAVTRAIVAALPDHAADMFESQVELQPARDMRGGGGEGVGAPASLGDARSFYNDVFLSNMEATVRAVVRDALDDAARAAAAIAEAHPAAFKAAAADMNVDFSFYPATAAAAATGGAADPAPRPLAPGAMPPLSQLQEPLDTAGAGLGLGPAAAAAPAAPSPAASASASASMAAAASLRDWDGAAGGGDAQTHGVPPPPTSQAQLRTTRARATAGAAAAAVPGARGAAVPALAARRQPVAPLRPSAAAAASSAGRGGKAAVLADFDPGAAGGRSAEPLRVRSGGAQQQQQQYGTASPLPLPQPGAAASAEHADGWMFTAPASPRASAAKHVLRPLAAPDANKAAAAMEVLAAATGAGKTPQPLGLGVAGADAEVLQGAGLVAAAVDKENVRTGGGAGESRRRPLVQLR